MGAYGTVARMVSVWFDSTHAHAQGTARRGLARHGTARLGMAGRGRGRGAAAQTTLTQLPASGGVGVMGALYRADQAEVVCVRPHHPTNFSKEINDGQIIEDARARTTT